jgi:hypothetical protein
MGRFLKENPELAAAGFPYQVLREVAMRLETPPDDPVFGVLPDATGEIPLDTVREWVAKLRRYLRRTARIGFYSLICRSGRIAFTDTHLDVTFRLSRADIRVRRAGLDLDPGWTPWLGRVVHFHYVGDGEYEA